MDKDIVPGLLEIIEQEFDAKTLSSKRLKKAMRMLQSKKATYADAHKFAIEVGETLSDVLKTHITPDKLPDGKMYYNIAERILNPTMQKNHELITSFAIDVQTELNRRAGLHLKAQAPELNQDRIDGLINRISHEDIFDEVSWTLNDPIVTFSQSVVDAAIKANIDFQTKAGLSCVVNRKVSGHNPCDWCKNIAGTYDIDEVPDDIYRRHSKCRCIVDYHPGDGRRQNVWTKTWRDEEKIEARKQIRMSPTDRRW